MAVRFFAGVIVHLPKPDTFLNSLQKSVLIYKQHGGYMRNTLRLLLITLLTGLLLCSYSDAAMKKTQKPTPTSKGAEHKMKTYYMGRFAIDLPEDFKLEIQSQKLSYAEVSDFKWKDKDRDKERNALWSNKIEEIKKLEVPDGKKQVIIEDVNFPKLGKWAKGVLYYGDYISPRRLFWTVLVDYGTAGVWLKISGIKNEQLINHFSDLLSRYQHGHNELTQNSFCLRHGRIELAYEEQESTYARFAGPMGMKLEIDMSETHEVEKVGILESLAAALATNFAPGIDVEKIRGHKRTVAGLKGEELVNRITEATGPELYFGWKYLGKEDSGEHPEIEITIDESPDSNLEEKLKIWDAALDSFRPVYKR